MGSLILQVISIALFAGITVAVAYFGGSALIGGGGKAKASGIISQGQQIEGTLSMYAASTPGYPADLNVLVTNSYLKQIPVLPDGMGAWTYTNGDPFIVTGAFVADTDTARTICTELEAQRLGEDAGAVTIDQAAIPTTSSANLGTFGCGGTDALGYGAYYRVR